MKTANGKTYSKIGLKQDKIYTYTLIFTDSHISLKNSTLTMIFDELDNFKYFFALN